MLPLQARQWRTDQLKKTLNNRLFVFSRGKKVVVGVTEGLVVTGDTSPPRISCASFRCNQRRITILFCHPPSPTRHSAGSKQVYEINIM